MYSMVILDDEKIVLQGIQKLCQKEDFGFVIKGAFVDSLKALDALPGLRPHLIITDVRMPQMDGLEFARRAKEILPESEIVDFVRVSRFFLCADCHADRSSVIIC